MARSSQTEGITIYFEGNSVEFDKTLDGMKKALQLLKSMTRTYNKEFKKTGDIDALAKATGTLIEQQEVAKRQVQAWADEVAKLKSENKESTDQYKQAIKQWSRSREVLINIEAQIEKNIEAINEFADTHRFDELTGKLEEVGDKFEQIGENLTNAGNAIKPFSDTAKKGLETATQSAIDFESSFADVLKTVNDPDADFPALKQGLRDLAKEVPTTASDLAKIAGLAGQMNVPADQLIEFTRAMVDFGNSTNVSAEEAAQDIAQIYNVIGKGGDFSTLRNMLSTIVELGNNSATTEKDIVEMFTNISAAGSRVGMTEAQMSALAATLASVNLDKGGASAISKVLTKIDMAVDSNTENLQIWAKTAGMSAEAFSKAWKDDASAALFEVLKGMSEAKDGGDSLNTILSELDVTELRQVDTLSRLVNAQKVYKENIDLANSSYEEGTALSDEASKRYKTVEARLKILKNTFIDFAISIGDMFLPIINKGIDLMTQFSTWLNNLSPSTKRLIATVTGVIAVLSPLLLGLGKVSSILGIFMNSILPKIIIKTQGFSTVITALKGALSFLLSPIGLVIAALTALYFTNEDFRNAVNELITALIGLLKPTIELIINVIKLWWAIIQKVIDTVVELFKKFQNTSWGQTFIAIIQQIIDWVKQAIDWLTQLISWISSAVSWFLRLIGVQSEASSSSGTANVRRGRGEIAPLNSGGFSSGGISLNATFTVNSAAAITRSDVQDWARWLADDINEELGRRI